MVQYFVTFLPNVKLILQCDVNMSFSSFIMHCLDAATYSRVIYSLKNKSHRQCMHNYIVLRCILNHIFKGLKSICGDLLPSTKHFSLTLHSRSLPSNYCQMKIRFLHFFLVPQTFWHLDSTNDRGTCLPASSPSAIWLFPLCETSRCPIFLSNPSFAFPISCLFLQRLALLTKWEK